jgi:subtilisin-like proprotein convertase family protein
MKKVLTVLLACLISLGLAGCGEESGPEVIDCSNLPPGKLMQECIDKAAPKADRIDAQNDPKLFGVNLDVIVSDLPLSGEVEQMAWPASYWPTYEDSANHRWQGQATMSPLEKYDMAFNDWTPPADFDKLIPFSDCGFEFDADYYEKLGPAAKYWSSNHGNRPRRDAWDQTCSGVSCPTGESCSDGQCYPADCPQQDCNYDEVCIEDQCVEKEDTCDDAIESWWGLCHAWVPAAILEAEPQKAVTYNGVTFEVSDIKALFLMMYNRSTTKFLGRRCNLREDEIERDENGRIKQEECRDTNAGSLHLVLTNLIGRDKRAFAEDRTMGYQVWNQPVVGYQVDLLEEITLTQALDLLDPDRQVCTNETYCYNEDAKKFYEVLIDVNYITESSASTEPMLPNIGRYTRTDTYHYILECEDTGEIIGGEWISARVTAFPDRISWPPDSQDNHTDFLWLPLRAGYSSNPHASLENVRMLARMSMEANPPPEGDAKVYKSTEMVSIPDNDEAGVVSAIEVADTMTIGTLKVTVDISHTYIGDLTLKLLHDGQEEILQKNAGGSTDDIQKTFEVTGFGGSVEGTWELLVVDGASKDTGAINSWELAVIAGDGGGSSAETFSMDSPTSIPDNDTDGVTSTINVPGGGAVKSLKVVVDISHTWISDLRVELRHGTGTATLHNREGNDSDDIQKTFSVDDFSGADSSGPWDLVVVDNANADEGVINSWSLKIER